MSFRIIVGVLLLLAIALNAASARCGDGVVDGAFSACCGDCDSSGNVTVDEILRLLSMALGLQELTESCIAGCCGSEEVCIDVSIDVVVSVIDYALHGCPRES